MSQQEKRKASSGGKQTSAPKNKGGIKETAPSKSRVRVSNSITSTGDSASRKHRQTTLTEAGREHSKATKSGGERIPNTTGRTVVLIGMLLLAALLIVGFITEQKTALHMLCDLFLYVFGIGFYTVPVVLVYMAADILIHIKGRLNVFRIICACTFPIFFGAVGHLFLVKVHPTGDLVQFLLETGRTADSGGLIAGGLAEVLCMALSSIGATIVLGVVLVFVLLRLCNMRISRIMENLADILNENSQESESHRARKRELKQARRKAERDALLAQRHAEKEAARAAEEARIAQETKQYEERTAQLRKYGIGQRPNIDIPLEKGPTIDIPLDMPDSTAPTGAFSASANTSRSTVPQKSEKTPNTPVVLPEQPEAGAGAFAMPENLRPGSENGNKTAQNTVESAENGSDEFASRPANVLPWEAEPKKPVLTQERSNVRWEKPEEVVHNVPSMSGMVMKKDTVAEEAGKSLLDEDVSRKPGMTAAEVELAVAASADVEPVQRNYELPPMELLHTEPPRNMESAEAEMRQNATKLIQTLQSFNIDAQIVAITRGPTVTRYEVQLSSGIRSARLTALSDDIALALAAQSVRIAPIPNKSAIGIEVPNRVTTIVYLRDVIASKEFRESKSKVTFALGKDIAGNPVVSDISRLPHMLVGGTTNSGKSVCINSLLISLIYKSTPAEVRLILIDPKMVEFASYNGIPHLLIPVVTDPKKASGALQWAVTEMMQRYKLFNENGVRNFTEYNELVDQIAAGDRPMPVGMDVVPEKLARIVIVIDELADMMLVSPGEVEESICRIAQMARAAGMHLIVATQRPSADVITGLMKANIPSRIAFSVASGMESRIILDQNGAERLIGRGDMLFSPIGANKPVRIQGCLVTSTEIDGVVDYVKNNFPAVYSTEVLEQIEKNAANVGNKGKGKGRAADEAEGDMDDLDEMFNDAVSIAVDNGRVSTSMLQSRLKLGYARAARIVDQMESCGLIGPYEGQKPRAILISKEDWAEMRLRREDR